MIPRRYSKILISLGASLIILGIVGTSAKATAGDTTRVSIASDGTQGVDGDVIDYVSISANGRYTVFASQFDNLVSGDTNNALDIFVHDRQTGETKRVSVASDGTEGNAGSYHPGISADGYYVVFESFASNLVSGDTNGFEDIFIHNLQNGETERISVASDGTEGNGDSSFASISADGRFVAFTSVANNLVNGDTNGYGDVFVHDRQTGTNERVSLSSYGTQGNYGGDISSISATGRYVAFESSSSNLVIGDTNNTSDIFVHDLQTGETKRVSVASDGTQANGMSWIDRSVISADGRFVVFCSWSSNLVNGDSNGFPDIFVHDRQTGITTRVSVASDGTQGNDFSYFHSISADGRYVAFDSGSSNLIDEDTNNSWDVFIHDQLTNTTSRVSVATNGAEGNMDSAFPFLSFDGRYVAFTSYASNLVAGDTNGVRDVFVHENGFPFWSMSGNVRDNSGNPLSDVLITVTTQMGDTVSTTISLADGTYQVPNLTSGTYLVYASKADYLFNPYPLTVILNSDRTSQNILGNLTSCILTNRINGADLAGNMCRLPNAQPFLELPFKYTDFSISANAREGFSPGLVTAWVDHDLQKSQMRYWGSSQSTSVGSMCNPSDPISLCYDQHEGTDFYLSKGTEVFPAYTGVVAEVCRRFPSDSQPCKYSASYGNYVLIDHENGYATLYGHLDSVSNWVQKNVRIHSDMSSPSILSPLGTVGNTGCYINQKPCGYHLHFSLLFNLNNSKDSEGKDTWEWGEEVDPYGPTINSTDPMNRPNIYMWKHPLYNSYSCNPSTETQTTQFGNFTASFQPGSCSTDNTVTLGISSLPGNLLESLRSASQSFFLSLTQWLQTGTNQFAIQQESTDFSISPSITIEYDPSAILHLVESQLTINRWDDLSGSWIALPTTLDTIAHTATAQTDSTGSFILQAPLTCLADTLEPNDNYGGASLVQADGTLVNNLFDIASDEDWFKFDAIAGAEYTIQTTNLAAGVDTVLEIYDTDGMTSLIADDNGGGGNASSLTWQAPADGTYYVRVTQAAGSTYGCNASYEIGVAVKYRIYLPLVIR